MANLGKAVKGRSKTKKDEGKSGEGGMLAKVQAMQNADLQKKLEQQVSPGGLFL